MDYENKNGTEEKNGSSQSSQNKRAVSLRDQVRMIADGSYKSSMSDRASVSREDEFDLNSKLVSLKNSPSPEAGTQKEDYVEMGVGKVTAYDDRYAIRRANVRSVSAVKKSGDKKTVKVKTAKKRTVTKRRPGAGRIIGRILICILTLAIFLAAAGFAFAHTVAYGPSTAARNKLVLDAQQYAITKWIPEFVLGKDTVDGIIASETEENTGTENVPADAVTGEEATANEG